mgnify:CR=1 FL=1
MGDTEKGRKGRKGGKSRKGRAGVRKAASRKRKPVRGSNRHVSDSPASSVSPAPLYPRIYAIVRRIPKGKVTSYGDIARRAGLAHGARQVGYALHALPAGTTVPWQRVLNAAGKVSLPPGSNSAITQRILLEQEGVGFLVDGRVGERYWWNGKREAGSGKREAGKK